MKKKIFLYTVMSALLILGVYLYIDHNKTQETKAISTPPCHINK